MTSARPVTGRKLLRSAFAALLLLARPPSTALVPAAEGTPEPPPSSTVPSPRLVEGFPDSGLPYRLTMPADATEVKPSRLVIWLHPTGGPFIQKVEELAPLFLKHRLALLVITKKKSFEGWTRDDALQLFGRTVPEVSGIAGIDARRPILMGFSAGGQLALKLWHLRPGDYSGIILDAAYPFETRPDGGQTPLDLPADEGVTSVPMFVLVGAKDVGAALWSKKEVSWKKAGVPLSILYVKDKRHEWLFGEEEIAALDAWLSTIGSGGSQAAPSPRAESSGSSTSRVVESAPEGGLAYRVTMSADATEAHPDRLVIWLDPTDGRLSDAAEAMAPSFLKHRMALIVITRKSSNGWSDVEAKQLFGVTLPEVAGIAGIDARKPILMGFSGGGQLAIALWHAKPGGYGGLILDAAYPLAPSAGEQALMELPPGDEKRDVPVFVLVGGDDKVASTWKKVESAWRRAGVPLTLRYVKGKGHQWLFDDEQTAALDAWLSSITPAAP